MEQQEKLEVRIARDERELRRAFEVLGSSVKAEFDLRARIRMQPLPWVAGALLVGVWLGWRS